MKCSIKYFLSVLILSFIIITANAQLNIEASKTLLQRVVPNYAKQFLIESLTQQNDKDVFEIESRNKKIVLRGNDGVAIASALYFYLNEYCHAQITWNGTNLNLPKVLPVVTTKIHKTTPYRTW